MVLPFLLYLYLTVSSTIWQALAGDSCHRSSSPFGEGCTDTEDATSFLQLSKTGRAPVKDEGSSDEQKHLLSSNWEADLHDIEEIKDSWSKSEDKKDEDKKKSSSSADTKKSSSKKAKQNSKDSSSSSHKSKDGKASSNEKEQSSSAKSADTDEQSSEAETLGETMPVDAVSQEIAAGQDQVSAAVQQIAAGIADLLAGRSEGKESSGDKSDSAISTKKSKAAAKDESKEETDKDADKDDAETASTDEGKKTAKDDSKASAASGEKSKAATKDHSKVKQKGSHHKQTKKGSDSKESTTSADAKSGTESKKSSDETVKILEKVLDDLEKRLEKDEDLDTSKSSMPSKSADAKDSSEDSKSGKKDKVSKKSSSYAADKESLDEQKDSAKKSSDDDKESSDEEEASAKASSDDKESSDEEKASAKASSDDKESSDEEKSSAKASSDDKESSDEEKSSAKASSDDKESSDEEKASAKASSDDKESSDEEKASAKASSDDKEDSDDQKDSSSSQSADAKESSESKGSSDSKKNKDSHKKEDSDSKKSSDSKKGKTSGKSADADKSADEEKDVDSKETSSSDDKEPSDKEADADNKEQSSSSTSKDVKEDVKDILNTLKLSLKKGKNSNEKESSSDDKSDEDKEQSDEKESKKSSSSTDAESSDAKDMKAILDAIKLSLEKNGSAEGTKNSSSSTAADTKKEIDEKPKLGIPVIMPSGVSVPGEDSSTDEESSEEKASSDTKNTTKKITKKNERVQTPTRTSTEGSVKIKTIISPPTSANQPADDSQSSDDPEDATESSDDHEHPYESSDDHLPAYFSKTHPKKTDIKKRIHFKEHKNVTVQPLDCKKYGKAIQIVKSSDIYPDGFLVMELNVETGSYAELWRVPFNRTSPPYEDFNGCGYNPVDGKVYCAIVANGSYIVRMDEDNIEFVAELPESTYNSAAFGPNSGAFYLATPKGSMLIVPDLATRSGYYDFLAAKEAQKLLDLTQEEKIQPKGWFHTADVVVTAHDFGDGPQEYVMSAYGPRLQVALYDFGSKKFANSWKLNISPQRWDNIYGAAWNFQGKLYFASNRGSGVRRIPVDELDLNDEKKEIFMEKAGLSDKASFNDGFNCINMPSPWISDVQPFDCKANSKPIHTYKVERPEWTHENFRLPCQEVIVAEQNFDGSTVPIYKVESTFTDPPFVSLNAAGINPVDSIAYGALKLEWWKSPEEPSAFYIVRFDGSRVEFVAKVQGENDAIAGSFDSSGTFFVSAHPHLWAFQQIDNWAGHSSQSSENLPIFNTSHALKLEGLEPLADMVVVKGAFDGGEPAEYLMAMNQHQQLFLLNLGTEESWILHTKKLHATSNDGGNFGAAWNFDGSIFFNSNDGEGIFQIPVDVISTNSTEPLTLNKVGKSMQQGDNDGMNCMGLPQIALMQQ